MTVKDHNWHEIKYDDLPTWVKKRKGWAYIRGKSFHYIQSKSFVSEEMRIFRKLRHKTNASTVEPTNFQNETYPRQPVPSTV